MEGIPWKRRRVHSPNDLRTYYVRYHCRHCRYYNEHNMVPALRLLIVQYERQRGEDAAPQCSELQLRQLWLYELIGGAA